MEENVNKEPVAEPQEEVTQVTAETTQQDVETPQPTEEPPTPAEEVPTETEAEPATAEEAPAKAEEALAEAEEAPAEAEEAPVEAEEAPAEAEEAPVEAEEAPVEAEEAPVAAQTKEEIIARLKELAESDDDIERQEADSLKSHFYRILKTEAEAAFKQFTDNGGDPESYEPAVEPLEQQFKDLFAIIRQKRAAQHEALEKLKEENYLRKVQIIEKIKAMLETPDDVNKEYNTFRELQTEWNSLKEVPAEKATELWKTYQVNVEKFYDTLKLNNEFRAYDFKKNLEKKLALCEAAERLTDEKNVIEAFRQLQNLHRLDKYAVEIAILFALLIMMILTTGNRRKYIFLILYMLFVAVLIIDVSLDGFLKNRVFLCILLPILVTYFSLLPNTTGKKRKWGICIAMAVLGGWYIYQTHETVLANRHREYQWTHLQQPILEYVPANAYVVTLGTTMNIQFANPWHVWPYEFRKYSLGWMTWIPLNTPVASSYRGLLREDMYVFAPANYAQERAAVARVREQIEKHYGVRTRVRPICHNGGYALIQLRVE